MATKTYGSDFARIYDEKWQGYAERSWPFLIGQVRRRCPEARTWLDLCCGTGTTARSACENGFVVLGVDASNHQIQHAKRRAPEARFVCEDIRRFEPPASFDVITCLFDSLNYVVQPEDLANLFQHIATWLVYRGLFLFDINTDVGLRERKLPLSSIDEPGRTVLIETSYDAEQELGHCRITGFVRSASKYHQFQEEHIQRGYRPDDIERMLREAGFQWRRYDGADFTPLAKADQTGRILYVCRQRHP